MESSPNPRTIAAHLPTVLAFVASFPFAATAVADELHYEDNRFGQRAMAMGGAVTAYPNEPEAIYYNPAGLVLQRGIKFSGSLQVGQHQWVSIDDALQERTLLEPTNVRNQAINFLPTSTVLSTTIGDRHALALGSFVVSDTDEVFDGFFEGPTNRTDDYSEIKYRLLETRRDRITIIGPTYAFKAADDFSLGASVYYAAHKRARTFSRRLSGSTTDVNGLDVADDFVLADVVANGNDGALFGRVGLYYRPVPFWSMGLACTSRSVSLHGSGSITAVVATSSFPPPDGDRAYVDAGFEGTTRTVYPWSCRVGAAVRPTSELTLTADMSGHLPVDYDLYDLPESFDRRATLNALFARRVEPEAVVNYGAGVEWLFESKWPLRVGAFTNLSAAPTVPASPVAMQAPDVDLFGTTLSGGYLGEDASINVGAEAQWGSGHWTTLTDLEAALSGEPVVTRIVRTERRFTLFVSGAVDFAEALVTDPDECVKRCEDAAEKAGDD